MRFLILAVALMWTFPEEKVPDYSYESQYGILEDYFDQEEIDLICRVIDSEASICPPESKMHVCSVILNRYFDGWGGDKGIRGVCRKGQFSLRREDYSEEAYNALNAVWQEGPTNDGYYFCRKKVSVFYGGSWLFADGYHNFYGRH